MNNDNPSPNNPENNPQSVQNPVSTFNAPTPPPTGNIPSPAPTPGTEAKIKKHKLATASLILSIVAIVVGVIWPVSALLAAIGLGLGIASLVKKHKQEGRAVSGIIISSVALILLPFWIAITSLAFFMSPFIDEDGNFTNTPQSVESDRNESTDNPSSAFTDETPCYTVNLPDIFTKDTSVNSDDVCGMSIISKNDPKKRSVFTIQARTAPDFDASKDKLKMVEDSLSKDGLTVNESKKITENGLDFYFASSTNKYGENSSVYFVDVADKGIVLQGQKISIFAISGPTVNSTVSGQLESIAKSFKLRANLPNGTASGVESN